MAETYRVTGTTEDGRTFVITSCCEWDWMTRFGLLDQVLLVDATFDMPRTCQEHRELLRREGLNGQVRAGD